MFQIAVRSILYTAIIEGYWEHRWDDIAQRRQIVEKGSLPLFDVLAMHGCGERIQFFCRFVRCGAAQDGKQGELVV